jgi:hypothetical protein
MDKQTDWTEFLNFFTEQNTGRRTRLGVFELNKDVVNDYWIEDGLPLAGLSMDTADGETTVHVTVGEMTHEVKGAIKLTAHFTSSGYEDGLDILTRDSRVTILRFESN